MSIRLDVLIAEQNARVRVSGPVFAAPGRYSMSKENGASSSRHPKILLFFILVRFRLSNMNATDF